MPIVRPRLFLDTDICIKVANENIDPAEWRRVLRRITTNYRYCISLITLKELFSKLARGSEDHFGKNKGALRVLDGPAKKTFLPYPPVFALRTVLQLPAARSDDSGLPEEEQAETVLEWVLDAPSKLSLKNGIPDRNNKRKVRFFDLDHFDTHETKPQNEHARLLQAIRDGEVDMPHPKKLAAWTIHDLGYAPYTYDCEKLANSLDAAFRYSAALAIMAQDKGYNFTRHASDWGDTVQLYYLCDESMHFLTCDADFRNRTKDSCQSARILLYPEFVRSLLP